VNLAKLKIITLLNKLSEDFPEVNVIEAIKAWAVNKLDKPLDKKSNPRLQIQTWFKKGAEWGQYKKQTQTKSELELINERIAKGEI
jgi:hypothetical protein